MASKEEIELGLKVVGGTEFESLLKRLVPLLQQVEAASGTVNNFLQVFSLNARKLNQGLGLLNPEIFQAKIAMTQLGNATKVVNQRVLNLDSKGFRKRIKDIKAGTDEFSQAMKEAKARSQAFNTQLALNPGNIGLRSQAKAAQKVVDALNKQAEAEKKRVADTKKAERELETQRKRDARNEERRQSKIKRLQQEKTSLIRQEKEAIKQGNNGQRQSLRLSILLKQQELNRLSLAKQTTEQLNREADAIERQRIKSQRANSPLQKRLDNPFELLKVQTLLLANFKAITLATQAVGFSARFIVELDKEMFNLQAITATTDIGMQGLRKTIISVSEATKFTAVEVAKTAVILGQAGFSAKEIGDSLKSITLLAAATGASLDEVSQIVTTTISAFSLQASEAGRVADIFTAAINNSKLTINKLALGMQFSANIASQLGVKFTELTALMGAMANAGVRSGSTLGTGLRRLLTALADPTEKLKEKMRILGLTMNDLDLQVNGVAGVLRNLKDAGFSTADSFEVFSVRAGAAFAALANNIDDVGLLRQEFVLNAAAAKANATQRKSLANLGAKFSSVFGSLVDDVFHPFLDVLKGALKAITGLFQAMRNPIAVVALRAVTVALGASFIALIFNMLKLGPALASTTAGMFALAVGETTAAAAAKGLVRSMLALKGIPLVAAISIAATVILSLAGAFLKAKDGAKELAAELEKTKDKAESYGSSIDAVNKRLDSLISKQKALENGTISLENVQRDLLTTALEMNNQFAKFGVTFDETGNSIDPLINQLEALRAKLEAVRIETLKTELVQQKAALRQSRNNLQNTAKDLLVSQSFGSGFNTSGTVSAALNLGDPSLTNALTSGNSTFKQRQKAQAILTAQQSDLLKGGATVDNSPELKNIGLLLAALLQLQGQGLEVDRNKLDLARAQLNQDQRQSSNALRDARKALNTAPTQTKAERELAIKTAQETLAQFQNQGSRGSQLSSQDFRREFNDLKGAIRDAQTKNFLANFKELRQSSQATLRQLGSQLSEIKKDISSGSLTANQIRSAQQSGVNVINAQAQVKRDLLAQNNDLHLNGKLTKAGQLKLDAINADAKARVGLFQETVVEALKKIQVGAEDLSRSVEKQFPELRTEKTGRKNRLDTLTAGLKGPAAAVATAQQNLKSARSPDNASFVTNSQVRDFAQQLRDAQVALRKRIVELTKIFIEGSQKSEERLKASVQETQAKIDAIEADTVARQAAGTISDAEVTANKKEVALLKAKVAKAQSQIDQLKTDIIGGTAAIAKNSPNAPIPRLGFFQGLSAAIRTASKDMKSFGQIGAAVGDTIVSSFGSAVEAVVVGAKSIGAAFKGMVTAILKEIVRLLAQKFAKFLLGKLFGGGTGGGGLFGGLFGKKVASPGSSLSTPATVIAMGGEVPRKMALGGIPNRDSVHALLMPGEVVLRKSAVDALGKKNLLKLNALGSSTVSKAGSLSLGRPQQPGGSVKVYVVSPDQQPTGLSPNEVLVTISNDILTGGQTKQLIKEVAIGNI